jgi:hypothetical protein
MTSTTRYIAKCKACTCLTSALCVGQDYARSKDDPRREGQAPAVYTHPITGSHVLDCRKCGQPRVAKPVHGVHNANHECNAKCLASTGFQCECSCGGKNHGAAHAA